MIGQISGVTAINNRRPEYTQIAAALGIFFVGALVYLFDRSAADIYFIPDWWPFADGEPGLFGAFGHSFPSFAHAYCFTLLISVLLMPWRISPLTICLGWFSVEAFFELTQIEPIARRVLVIIPDWFQGVPILKNVPYYFLYGRFDPFDLALAGIGAVAAYLTIIFSNRMGVQTDVTN
jgi:hypothetical protein